MHQLWRGDLNEVGQNVLRRYEEDLPEQALSDAMGAVFGFFGSNAVLAVMGAQVGDGYLDWRYAAVVVAATFSGYLVGRYLERREATHGQAVINALYAAGMKADKRMG